MNYRFNKTDDGVITDKKVQAAVTKLDTLEARGTLIIEAGYKDTNDAYCKITGTMLKAPVNAGGKKVGEAVNDAVKKVSTIIRNEKQTVKDKKEQVRRTCAKRNAEKIDDEILGR
ncbi:MAG: hypothetical protein ACLRFE_00755 [Clostridia bacterium]